MKNNDIIKQYLESNKVSPFWAASAMSWIERVLAGNMFFVQDVSNPKLRTKDGHVSRFECDATAIVPDTGKTVKAHIIYTFNPKLTKAHYATIKSLCLKKMSDKMSRSF